jgi:hypothetical protein
MLKESKDDFKRIKNDNDNKYNNDKLPINLLYIILQPSNKGYANRDYSNKEYTD